jgi:hypothetical protein
MLQQTMALQQNKICKMLQQVQRSHKWKIIMLRQNENQESGWERKKNITIKSIYKCNAKGYWW